MIKILCAVFVMFIISGCHAHTVGVHLGSVHSTKYQNNGETWNNTNPGVYVRTDTNWVVGGYYNSMRKPTIYAGKVWPIYQAGNLKLDLTTGLATGYRFAVVPLVSPSVKFDGLPFRLHYIPGIGGPHVLHISYERKFE